MKYLILCFMFTSVAFLNPEKEKRKLFINTKNMKSLISRIFLSMVNLEILETFLSLIVIKENSKINYLIERTLDQK